MIPHLKGRPVSLVRAPEGVGGELFFQKHAEISRMPGVKQFKQSLDPAHPPMLEVPSEQALLSAAQMNVVELHTQNANGSSYENPTAWSSTSIPARASPGSGTGGCGIDARFPRPTGLPAFLKTSGGKGLHVVVPVKPGYGWDDEGLRRRSSPMAQTIPERWC
jgi:bifunctional non-homologous end joining protein LigD